jgi:hypothetical protein
VRALDPAGDIGVQALDPMREPEPLQELQRPVDRGRLGRLALVAEGRDQVVSLQRRIGRQQEFQNAPAGRGQALPGAFAPDLGRPQRAGERRALQAVVMVVRVMIAGVRHALS